MDSAAGTALKAAAARTARRVEVRGVVSVGASLPRPTGRACCTAKLASLDRPGVFEHAGTLRIPMDRVRDAMITEPRSLPATATAREAGEVLSPPEVRAVFVVDTDGRLVGVVTRKTLVTRVVARGLDPAVTPLEAIAETPHYTLGPDVPLEEAFRFIEEQGAERVPVVEDGRLIGVVSRAVLQRRLAEDEEPPELPPAA